MTHEKWLQDPSEWNDIAILIFISFPVISGTKIKQNKQIHHIFLQINVDVETFSACLFEDK